MLPYAGKEGKRGKRLRLRLSELDPIAKRVAKLEAIKARDPNLFLDFNPVLRQLFTPLGDMCHLIGEVGFGGGAGYAVFRAHMDLHVPQGQPETASSLERGGLFDFREAEQVTVKRAGLDFSSFGDGDLGVVEAFKLQGVVSTLIHSPRLT